MDVALCIELHNKIVDHALKALEGKTKAKKTRNWFKHYEDKGSERARDLIPQELTTFFENIDVVDPNLLSFNPFLRGVAAPPELPGDRTKEPFQKQCKKKICAILYQAIDQEDSRGLIIDLRSLKCYYLSSTETELSDDWDWQPLEFVLGKWWEMIKTGKYAIDASPESLETDPEYGAIGWTMMPYVASDVDEAVDAWDRYVNAIVRRLPEDVSKTLPATITRGWVDEAELEKLEVKGFVRDFLTRARRPPSGISNVAPGLQILDDETLKGFGRILLQRKEEFEWVDPADMTFPLCLSSHRFPESALSAALEGLDFLRKQFLYDDRAGLYIRPSSDALYSDSVAMITPYENPDYTGDIFELRRRVFEYQKQGVCPYQPPHDIRLVSVLKKWIQLLEDGGWTVGKDGVEGLIDDWEAVVSGKHKEKAKMTECCH